MQRFKYWVRSDCPFLLESDSLATVITSVRTFKCLSGSWLLLKPTSAKGRRRRRRRANLDSAECLSGLCVLLLLVFSIWVQFNMANTYTIHPFCNSCFSCTHLWALLVILTPIQRPIVLRIKMENLLNPARLCISNLWHTQCNYINVCKNKNIVSMTDSILHKVQAFTSVQFLQRFL